MSIPGNSVVALAHRGDLAAIADTWGAGGDWNSLGIWYGQKMLDSLQVLFILRRNGVIVVKTNDIYTALKHLGMNPILDEHDYED